MASVVCGCMNCHSTRDWSRYSAPVTEGSFGKGGNSFGEDRGYPGTFVAGNLTPYGLGSWTDGEIFRAITQGIHKDERPLYPVMPYRYYGQMDSTDIIAIIAWLRQLPPIPNDPPPNQTGLIMKLLMRLGPKHPEFHTKPDSNNLLAHGAYLLHAAGCHNCHSPRDQDRKPLPGRAFSGGRKFQTPLGNTLVSTNLTPDRQSGIGNWTYQQFADRFQIYADSLYEPPLQGGQDERQTNMPWRQYGKLKPHDLYAMYLYLHSLPPVYRPELVNPTRP